MSELGPGPVVLSYDEELSLGHSVLAANGIVGARPVITANYVGPDHELPLPWPSGDSYLRETFVPAVRAGEIVIAHTLIPGLRDYYTEIGLLPEGAEVIEVESGNDGSSYGFPATDPLERLRGNVGFDGDRPHYLCATFGGEAVDQQAWDLHLHTLNRAPSSQSNNKALLRQAAEEAGFTMLPGTTISNREEMAAAVAADWNTDKGTWLKFPTGSGGDLVIRIKERATPELLENAITQLRNNVRKAFTEGAFAVGFEDFWPGDTFAPAAFPLVLEADAGILGEMEANGSTQFITRQAGGLSILGHFVQITTESGEYLGNEPFPDIDPETRAAAEQQAAKVGGNYLQAAHDYNGFAGIDWFVTHSKEWGRRLSVVELNARPTANTPPVIIAQKLGAPHFLNTNAYTDTPIGDIRDFVRVVGEDLAYGDPNEAGMVVPQAFRSFVRRDGVVASPNFKVAILGRDSAQCHAIMTSLGNTGIRFEP